MLKKMTTSNSLPGLDSLLANDSSIKSEVNNNLRETERWKSLYKQLSNESGLFKNEDAFLKHIDKLASMKKVNQKNIIGSWNKYKPDDYDKAFKEKVAEFGSEEKYYEWLEEEKKIVKKKEIAEQKEIEKSLKE